MFGWLKKLFKKIMSFLKKFWPLLLIAAVFFIPGVSAFLSSAWTWLGGVVESYGLWTTLALGLGALAIVSPEAAASVVGRAGDVVGEVGKVVGEVAGDVTESVLSSSGLPLLIIGGLVLWMVLSDRDTSTAYLIEE